MTALTSKFMKDESGATMVEYAILVALISVAAIVVIQVLGNKINNVFNNVQSKINS